MVRQHRTCRTYWHSPALDMRHSELDTANHCAGLSGTCMRATVVNLPLCIIPVFGSRVGAGGVETTAHEESPVGAIGVLHWLIRINKLSQYSTTKYYQLLCLVNIIWWHDRKLVVWLFHSFIDCGVVFSSTECTVPMNSFILTEEFWHFLLFYRKARRFHKHCC